MALIAVKPSDVDKYLSPYGNYFYTITDDLISALNRGEMLVDSDWDEYGVVIEKGGATE